MSTATTAPLVSVVISTHNRRPLLAAALASALGQDHHDLEVIVVDNGSTDDTATFLERVEDRRVRVLRNQTSLGPTEGRNTGLRTARGDWVALLDDDDLWAPTKLRMQMGAALAAGSDWSYTGCVYIDGHGRLIGGAPAPTPDDVMRLLPYRYVVPGGLSGLLWRREILDEGGLLDARLAHTADWDLTLRLAASGSPAMVAQPLVAYRQHGSNHSRGAARYADEFDLIAAKHGAQRGGRPLDYGVLHRFFGSQALMAGHRGVAARAYWAGARAGDRGSALRMLGLPLPRKAVPLARRLLLSKRDWLAVARQWVGASRRRPRVVIVQSCVLGYRVPFYEHLRELLASADIDFELVHSSRCLCDPGENLGSIPWASHVPARRIRLGRRTLTWQRCLGRVATADLVVVEQASQLLLNYLLLSWQGLGGPKVAFWGHGRNFDQAEASSVGEFVKRLSSTRAHWWFPYNRKAAQVVVDLGFDSERMTIVRNATDTRRLHRELRAIDDHALDEFRTELGVRGDRVALYVGALRRSKRIAFLIDAAERVRTSIDDFELVIAGTGEELALVEAAAARHDWIHHAGARHGAELAPLLRLASVLMVPGWVGLVIVDSFAAGVPLVASGSGDHPPEIDYLVDGFNGRLVDDGGDPAVYAAAVAEVLTDAELRDRLVDGCRDEFRRSSVEQMAVRFATGLELALGKRRSDRSTSDAGH